MRPTLLLLLCAPLAACATTWTASGGPDPAAPGVAARADTFVNRLPQRDEPVRIVFPATGTQPRRTLTGNFRRLAGDTLIVARGIQTDTVRLGNGRQLQVVTSSRGHGGKGAAIGALVGAVVGGVAGAASYQPGAIMDYGQAGEALGGALVGALPGALIGWLVGSSSRTEEWGTVNPQAVGVSVGPGRLGLRVTF